MLLRLFSPPWIVSDNVGKTIPRLGRSFEVSEPLVGTRQPIVSKGVTGVFGHHVFKIFSSRRIVTCPQVIVVHEIHHEVYLIDNSLDLTRVYARGVDNRLGSHKVYEARLPDVAVFHTDLVQTATENRYGAKDVRPIETYVQ